MTDRHPVDVRAEELQKKANEQIARLCASSSVLQYSQIVEETTQEILGEDWEWILFSTLGHANYPTIAITRYNGRYSEEQGFRSIESELDSPEEWS